MERGRVRERAQDKVSLNIIIKFIKLLNMVKYRAVVTIIGPELDEIQDRLGRGVM